ncbi:hypothetical protein KEM55_000365 [Ascosphaera atra]|nr:hypothetical protein KEM55_000365 [Ascosphaera atra]
MSSIPRSRSMTPQRSHTHPGHLSFTNIHAQSDATATASVPMANSYADPSRLRRIPKDSPPRARPASSVAGAINVAGTGSSGADFSGRLSMRFDNADRILEDPVIEARGDAATTSGTTHAMPNYPAMAPTSPAVGAPRPPPAAGRYSEDLTRVSRKDSPLYLEPQQDVPFNKSESHVSMSQMLLNSTKHVSLLKKKPEEQSGVESGQKSEHGKHTKHEFWGPRE